MLCVVLWTFENVNEISKQLKNVFLSCFDMFHLLTLPRVNHPLARDASLSFSFPGGTLLTLQIQAQTHARKILAFEIIICK